MSIISNNIKLLFELLKEKTNRKAIDFCKESAMRPTNISHWIHANRYPAKRSIVALVNYFNGQLKLKLTPEVLEFNDLEKNINKFFVVNNDLKTLSNEEKECLGEFRRLSPRGQETILRLLKDFE